MVAGQTVSVVATGFTGTESVTVTVHSTPETLATVSAASGSVTYSFVVPSDLATGSHYLQLVGGTSNVSVVWPFTLGTATPTPATAVLGETVSTTPTSLPFTGADIGKPMLFAVAALWSGLVLLLLSRRGSLYAQAAPAGYGGAYRAAVQLPEVATYGGRHRVSAQGRHVSGERRRRRH